VTRVKALSHKMTLSHETTVLISQHIISEVLMSQNVLISQNYVMKLIPVGGFMMWRNDNDFWARVRAESGLGLGLG